VILETSCGTEEVKVLVYENLSLEKTGNEINNGDGEQLRESETMVSLPLSEEFHTHETGE
jgi:hypothetical protein